MASRNFAAGDRVAVATGERNPDDNQFHPEGGYYHAVLMGFVDTAAHIMSELGEEQIVDAARLMEPVE